MANKQSDFDTLEEEQNARKLLDALGWNKEVSAYQTLDEAVDGHELWLETKDTDIIQGRQLDFTTIRYPFEERDGGVTSLYLNDFTGRNLSEANFTSVDLTGADFTGATLKQTNFQYADLSGAVFVGADATDTILTGAILTDAIISEDQLKAVIMTNSDAEFAEAVGALGDEMYEDADYDEEDAEFAEAVDALGTDAAIEL